MVQDARRSPRVMSVAGSLYRVSRIASPFDIRSRRERSTSGTRSRGGMFRIRCAEFSRTLTSFQPSRLPPKGNSKEKLGLVVIEEAARRSTRAGCVRSCVSCATLGAPLAVRTIGEELAADAANGGSAVLQSRWTASRAASIRAYGRDFIGSRARAAQRVRHRTSAPDRSGKNSATDDRQLCLARPG